MVLDLDADVELAVMKVKNVSSEGKLIDKQFIHCPMPWV